MMKIEKSKIVFVSILVVIVAFLITYTMMITGMTRKMSILKKQKYPS